MKRSFKKIVWAGLTLAMVAMVSPQISTAQSVFLKPADALKLLFKDSEEVIKEDKTLSEAQMSEFKTLEGHDPPRSTYTFYLGRTGGTIDGYALIDEQIGKVMPITFITRINPDGKVAAVEIMVYRETHGGEVASRRFLNQFKQKSLNDELRLHGNIVNITGATLSSHALVIGVKRALALWQIFYGKLSPPSG
jgi:Na+-translocating ferredoxin:NAD+ oxidoreductase RnfG subunit